VFFPRGDHRKNGSPGLLTLCAPRKQHALFGEQLLESRRRRDYHPNSLESIVARVANEKD
jgi:hypothetical protein